MNSGLKIAVFQYGMNAKWHAKRMATERASLSVTVVLSFAFFLMGCTAEENVSQISLSGEGLAAVSPSSSKVIERDIEAPEVFQLTGLGVWDGRPSLGGVWVAHLSAPSAERVIVRNGKSGKFVIGALFRRNDVKDGVPFQISAAAAKVFGVSSGQQIIIDGDFGEEMFIIARGSVEISKVLRGKRVVLSTFGRGEFFGEMSLLEGVQRSADVFAKEDTELLCISSGGLLLKIRRDPTFALEMLQSFSSRLRQANERLSKEVQKGNILKSDINL